MDLLLRELTWTNGSKIIKGDIRIGGDKIIQINDTLTAKKKEKVITLRNHYLYPGLINAHDHLEMNLYPRMGNPPYENYKQWAKDIYRPGESPVKEIESIPVKYRLLWGGYKNLISGVTTVVHHNPWHRLLARRNFPVKVLRKYHWAHSLAFDKKVFRNFSSRPNVPFIIHAAEGVDDLAKGEIRHLHELQVLKKNTVIVHGVGLSESDLLLLLEAQPSLVWCPSSNLFMFGRTAAVSTLKHTLKVSLGSDSLMTGSASLLEEMQVAAKTGLADAPEIFNMVTSMPARIFNLPMREIKEGEKADLLILPATKQDYYENLLCQLPGDVVAVFVDGELGFADAALAQDLNVKLKLLKIGTSVKGIVMDITDLRLNILKKVGEATLEMNPLWKMTQPVATR